MGINAVRAALTTPYVTKLIQVNARRLCRRQEFCDLEPQDMQHELAAAILRQAHHFDPVRGSVNTFISRVVASAALMMVRDQNRQKRCVRIRHSSIERDTVARESGKVPIGELLSAEDRLRHQGIVGDEERDGATATADELRAVLAGLRPQLQLICGRLMAGGTQNAVARELGVSRRQMRKAMDELRELLKMAGFEKF